MKDYLYISLKGDDVVARFSIQEDGSLSERADLPIAGGPGPMAVALLSKKYFFIGLRESSELVCMRLLKDGGFSLSGKVSLPSDPCFLEIDKEGRYVFSTYYMAGQVAVHCWDETKGSLTEVQRLDTEPKAHSIRLAKSGRYAYAMHTGPNKIYLYTFDPETGYLTPRDSLWIVPKTGIEPRHSCHHPSLPCLYVIGELGCVLHVYDCNEDTGDIVLKQSKIGRAHV